MRVNSFLTAFNKPSPSGNRGLPASLTDGLLIIVNQTFSSLSYLSIINLVSQKFFSYKISQLELLLLLHSFQKASHHVWVLGRESAGRGRKGDGRMSRAVEVRWQHFKKGGRTSEMVQQIKALAFCQVRPHVVKERINLSTLSSDLRTCCGPCKNK